ncbi:MAG TPA: mechanosensitive ion channel domain-containing protein [Xanthobacteraceae bacterium]
METIRDAFVALRDALAFAPSGVIGVLILALAAVIAIAVHEILTRLLRRLLDSRQPYLRSLLNAVSGLTRLAFLIIALVIVLPVAPIDPTAIAVLTRILSLATIALLGWIALTATHVTGDLYLRRLRLDAADDLLARKHITQVRIMRRVVDTLIVVLTVSAALMTFQSVRQYGVSLFASAGVAGLVVGLAARPMLSNLIAGIQIATTQPIRLDDEVVVENQWGRIEEITSTYVVIKLWDLRRLIVPLSYFIEKPFESWTRESTELIGAVSFHVSYMTPIERLREKALEIVRASPLWDGDVAKLQVNDAKEAALELRVLASARTSGAVADLRTEIREKMITFLQREYPTCLPQLVAAPPVPQPTRPPDVPSPPARKST